LSHSSKIMKKPMDREEKFMELAPRLFADHCWIDCGTGWDCILEDLCRNLEKIINVKIEAGYWSEMDHPVATQIKEKFGTLRFYISSGTDAMFDLIEEAESESSQTCEQCGCQGKMRQAHLWYSVRCDTCWNKNKENICSAS